MDLDGRKIDFRLIREGQDSSEPRGAARSAHRDKTGQSAEPDSAVAALERVRQQDRGAKAGRKKASGSSAAHPVKAAVGAARKASAKSAGAKTGRSKRR